MRFRGVAYSGGTIPQYGFYGDACIDLASLRLPERELFALVDHEPAKRAGKFSARVEANSIISRGRPVRQYRGRARGLRADARRRAMADVRRYPGGRRAIGQTPQGGL